MNILAHLKVICWDSCVHKGCITLHPLVVLCGFDVVRLKVGFKSTRLEQKGLKTLKAAVGQKNNCKEIKVFFFFKQKWEHILPANN